MTDETKEPVCKMCKGVGTIRRKVYNVPYQLSQMVVEKHPYICETERDCPTCNGPVCKTCEGHGWVRVFHHKEGYYSNNRICPDCGGSGKEKK